jgi:hypothetical protein
VLYGDKAYNEYFTEDVLADACRIDLLPHRKKNSTRAVPPMSNISSRSIAGRLRRDSAC